MRLPTKTLPFTRIASSAGMLFATCEAREYLIAVKLDNATEVSWYFKIVIC